MSWKTQNSRRPELEALEVNAPEGYIGNRLYPKETVAQKTGTIYYTPAGSKITAQQGRDPKTGALNRNFFGSANKTYSTTNVEARIAIPRDEVAQFGGVDAADQHGAKAVKRAVLAKNEAAAAAAATAGEAVTVTDGTFFSGVRSACKALKPYSGTLALVMSLEAYGKLLDFEEVRKRLTFNGGSVMDREALESLKPEVLKDMLQNVFAVKEILIGDDEFWPEDKIVVAKLPSAEPLSYKLAPELGKMVAYATDGVEVCEIETAANTDLLVNDYTAIAYSQIVEFNEGARQVLQLSEAAPDADNGDSEAAPDADNGEEE